MPPLRGPDGGPPVPVKISPQDFHTVAQHFCDRAGDLISTMEKLFGGLNNATGAAGVDDAAKKFDGAYQRAASSLLDAFNRAVNLLYDIASGIDMSATNHWRADADATPGGGQSPPWSPVDAGLYLPRDLPHGSLVGKPIFAVPPPFDSTIPLGHTDVLRAMATALTNAANSVDDITTSLGNDLKFLFEDSQGAEMDAMNQFWDMVGGPSDSAILTAVHRGCTQLASALSDYADWIDNTDDQILDKITDTLKNMALGAAAGIAVGAVVGLFTGGTGAIPAMIAAADEVGEGVSLASAVAGVFETAVNGAYAAVGAAAGGIPVMMQAAISAAPDPNLTPADTTSISDAQETEAAENLASKVETQSPEHIHELGTDPDSGQFRQSEADTAVRIENERGVRLTRVTDGSGADWMGSDGKTYDAVGNFPSKFFDSQWANLKDQIVRHLQFKAEYIPVDVSQFTADQVATVKQFVEQHAPRAFVVGE